MDTRATRNVTPASPGLSPALWAQRRRARLRSWMTGVVAALAIAITGAVLFMPEPIRVELATVAAGPMQVTIDNQGQVRAHDKYVIAAPVAAELQRIDLHDGDPVHKGQLLAILDALPMDPSQRQEALARLDGASALAREAALEVRRAYNNMQLAISERSRIESLVEGKFVSPQAAEKAITAERVSRVEYDAARSHEEAAIADVRAAEAALYAADIPKPAAKPTTKSSTKSPAKSAATSATAAPAKSAEDTRGQRQIALSSPVDGYVLKVHEQSARTVSAGAPLITIADPKRYEVVADILSTDAVKVKAGDTMLIEGWGGGKVLLATVRTVEPLAFTKISALGVEEQRVNVIAAPVDDLSPMGDGYRVEARIVIWSSDLAVKVPGSSLFRAGESWHVFTVEDGRAREREVRVGQRNQQEAQVLQGLEPGATVIRFPGNQIRDGARVKRSDTVAGRP